MKDPRLSTSGTLIVTPQQDFCPDWRSELLPSNIACYAHTLPDRPEVEWEPLEVHLQEVARRAAEFAEGFASREWGWLAGLWHDLGKYRPEFQQRLRGSREHVEHAGLGAALAARKGRPGLALAFAIAGHHAGLANKEVRGDTDIRTLKERLNDNERVLAALEPLLPGGPTATSLPALPGYLLSAGPGPVGARRWELWTRFIFSALVDADRLATEAFCDPKRANRRLRPYAALDELRARLDTFMQRFRSDTAVNELRAQVLRDCYAAAQLPPGFFSLTAPTGAGKTLAGMAFALTHACRHNMSRVIVVVPYTSIIEQNAQVYRLAVGADHVVEHHASIDEEQRYEEYGEQETRRRLAAENWDAPVVVTTTVQLFESLLSNRPSRCRKLHNLVRSVLILDEAQALPAGYLSCLLDVMRELVQVYGCSIVISTATQPAIGRREALPDGLENVREIIGAPDSLARALKRVTVCWPKRKGPPVPYAELAGELAQHRQVLAVVHRRRDARELAAALPSDGRYHLSALMCPAHRAEVLADIKAALDRKQVCRAVSTQLVEAGVDVDFPVVYRALAGLDSVAQAAGRCNREGTLPRGDFRLFRAETLPPPGVLRKALEATEALLARHGEDLDFANPEHLEEYFRDLYFRCDRDRKGVQAQREQLNFATVGQSVQLVEDEFLRPIVVSWKEGPSRLTRYRAHPHRRTLRALQPFVIQIHDAHLRALAREGAVEEVNESLHALTHQYAHLYSEDFGLLVEMDASTEPGVLIA